MTFFSFDNLSIVENIVLYFSFNNLSISTLEFGEGWFDYYSFDSNTYEVEEIYNVRSKTRMINSRVDLNEFIMVNNHYGFGYLGGKRQEVSSPKSTFRFVTFEFENTFSYDTDENEFYSINDLEEFSLGKPDDSDHVNFEHEYVENLFFKTFFM